VGDLVFDSFHFEDVPLGALMDIDVAWLGHRIHCEFVGFLLENVANFECAQDTVARCDARE
jgi:hypothetical protein